MTGKFIQIDVCPGEIGLNSYFPGFFQILIQRETSRGEAMKYVGTLTNDTPEIVSEFSNLAFEFVSSILKCTRFVSIRKQLSILDNLSVNCYSQRAYCKIYSFETSPGKGDPM